MFILYFMRAVDISIDRVTGGVSRLKASFSKNLKFYFQEALGLGIFMVSACFFSGLLFGKNGYFVSEFSAFIRQAILGLFMGLTAVFIFYSRFTSSSGSHINPAVTLSFFRVGKINRWDTFFYILFQFIGGTVTVYIMAALMGENLTSSPLYDVVTVPGKYGPFAAAITELITAFVMMCMVLFTADHAVLKKYSRIIAGILVCLYVIIAGPISGFGMNPARSFASALPSNVWTSFWIYIFLPLAGMLGAAELYLAIKKKNKSLTVDR
jgi:aquaporin Z